VLGVFGVVVVIQIPMISTNVKNVEKASSSSVGMCVIFPSIVHLS
jgi:hypothetical protein